MADNDSQGPKTFGSVGEEAAFWKKKAEDLMVEFQEFQEGSRELEAELEAQLDQSERKVKEYRSLSNRLHMENDELKAKLEQSHKEYAYQVSSPTIY